MPQRAPISPQCSTNFSMTGFSFISFFTDNTINSGFGQVFHYGLARRFAVMVLQSDSTCHRLDFLQLFQRA
jgi:hypothetical protein